MKHTKGNWSINFWTPGKNGITCLAIEDGIRYYSASGIHEEYFNIVTDAAPIDHRCFGSFEGGHIAKLPIAYEGKDEAIANARLIAAAPELLAALNEMVAEARAHGQVRHGTATRAEMALAKAYGFDYATK